MENKNGLDLVCPVCDCIVDRMSSDSIAWVTELYCRRYLDHVDACRNAIKYQSNSGASAMPPAQFWFNGQ